MKLSIEINKTEMASALTLSTETNTKNFMEHFVPGYTTSQPYLTNIEKMKAAIGLEVVKSHTFTAIDNKIDVEVTFTKEYVRISADTDLVMFHEVLRKVYSDPEGLEKNIEQGMKRKKKVIRGYIKDVRRKLKELSSNIAKL